MRVRADDSASTQILMTQKVEAAPDSKPQRFNIERPVDLHVGDTIDFWIHARANHECDGVLLIDMQVR